MALRLVNTTPQTVGSLVSPGTPIAFSLKTDSDSHLDLGSLNVRYGFSRAVARMNGQSEVLAPETDSLLAEVASVSTGTPEHRISVGGMGLAVGPLGQLDIGPSVNGICSSIYEISLPATAHSPVLAKISFSINNSWTRLTPYWSNLSDVVPIYFGLEYGPLNSGLFVSLRDDGSPGGSIVAGGPIQAFNAARPGQVERTVGVDWKSSSSYSLFILVDPDQGTFAIWKQSQLDQTPVQIGASISAVSLGTFQPATSALSQRRSGPSGLSTLYFGSGATATSADYRVLVSDWAVYQHFPQAVENGEACINHAFTKSPDTPFVFKSSEKVLPTAPGRNRWFVGSSVTPDVSFWTQPGRPTEPLYTDIKLPANGSGEAFLRRSEPQLTQSDYTFGSSIEAWVMGDTALSRGVDKGFGFRINDGTGLYEVVGVDLNGSRTYAIRRDPAIVDDPGSEFYIPGGVDTPIVADHSALRLVRLTVDHRRDKLNLFVEDPDAPILSIPLDDPAYPIPEALSTEGFFDVGVFSSFAVSGGLKLAALSFLQRYMSWEGADGLLPAFTEDYVGSGTSVMTSNGTLLLTKSAESLNSTRALRRSGHGCEFSYLRGFQIDFRTRTPTYNAGAEDSPPGVWTGAGLTVFLGASESPGSVSKQVHVGFFDCGPYGKKVAIVPHDGLDDVLQQTARGRKCSATLEWESFHTLRLVYRPFKSVELWDANLLKGVPLITIPWAEFECADDPTDQDPSIQIGMANQWVSGSSEWSYLRWGISTGYDVEITQAIQDLPSIQDGLVYAVIDADEATGALPPIGPVGLGVGLPFPLVG